MRKKVVMFVDDDDSFLYFVRQACRKIEQVHDVLEARDGMEGIDRLKDLLRENKSLPNLIFVDINMPRLDGFGFLENFNELRERHHELRDVKPITMLTSSEQSRDREKAQRLKADQYIVKPATLAEARQIISEATQ
ncbi:MAG: response regulator [Bdellovibrionaceae bacterium]|nr:response regulator [Pseudobdellovibrionaceae bacterium]MBX3033422.1 response regulator [Pseudobdellovibrionaceae bacterium]